MSKDPKIKPDVIDKAEYPPSEYPSLQELLEKYFSAIKPENYPIYAVFGIPGPVKSNEVLHITNIPHWPKFSGKELAEKFNIKKVVLLNDFACNGYGVQTDLKLNDDYVILNDVQPEKDGPKLIIGPGTGLGMGFLLKEEGNEYYTIGASEGGHQDYTAKNPEAFALREYFLKTLGNQEMSIERILSGQGLMIIYRFLKMNDSTTKRDKELEAKIDAYTGSPTAPEANKINLELTKKGVSGECELARKTLNYFIGVFGDVAGDMSLFTCPTGGLYLVGGISNAFAPLISGSSIFMDHYLNKDNFAFLLKTFPVYLVKNGNIGMLGAAECARRLLLQEQ